MSNFLRKVFGFILNPLEAGDAEVVINPLSRKVLIVMGILFLALASGTIFVYFKMGMADDSYLLPGSVFSLVGLVCLIVGCLGNDRAVAKIWGGKSV